MMIKTTTSHSGFLSIALVFTQYFAQLTKARLSFSVVFSSIAGYILGCEVIDPNELSLLLFGGLAIAGASNAFNQIIERDIDGQMERTKNRPIPSGNMTHAAYEVFSPESDQVFEIGLTPTRACSGHAKATKAILIGMWF